LNNNLEIYRLKDKELRKCRKKISLLFKNLFPKTNWNKLSKENRIKKRKKEKQKKKEKRI
jgi:hypothetical protein